MMCAWMVKALESETLTEADTRAAASHWALSGKAFLPECGAQPIANSACLRKRDGEMWRPRTL
eukprot:scaffold107179_cov63-Phaeocystis_antarctica.AAC.2